MRRQCPNDRTLRLPNLDWLRRAVWSGPGGSSAAAEATAQSSTLCRLGAGPPPSPLFLLFLRLPGISFFLAAGRGRVWISEATCSSAHQSEFCNIWMRNGRPHHRHFHSSAQLSVSLIYPRVCLDFPGDMEVKSTNQIVSNLVWSVCFTYICRACKSVAGGSVGASSTTQAAPRLQMFLNEKKPLLSRFKGVCGIF